MTETASLSEHAAANAAHLAATVLEAEAEREAQQAAASEPVLFADDLLPGVDTEEVSLGGALRRGGTMTFVVLLLLTSCRRARVFDPRSVGTGPAQCVGRRQWHDRVPGVRVRASSCWARCGWGWLADHSPSRARIGWATLAFSVFVALVGPGRRAHSSCSGGDPAPAL